MFELQFVFTEEPSLLRGNSKRKSLTLARNKAHASRHGHVQRKKAMLECTSKVKKSREQDCAHHNFHRPGVNELLDWNYDEKVLDAIDSGLYTSRPKPTAVYRVATLESSLTPYPTSLYLTSTYGHREASRINRLFDFRMLEANIYRCCTDCDQLFNFMVQIIYGAYSATRGSDKRIERT